MELEFNYRSDVNPPDSCRGRTRALFYAICRACDEAHVELLPRYRLSVELFARSLERLERLRERVRGGTSVTGADIADMFEHFIFVLGMAARFELSASTVSDLILTGHDADTALRNELAALKREEGRKPH